jgi:hypothetical protein
VLVRDKLEMLRFGAPLSECAIAVCANARKSERMPDHCVSDCNRNSIPNRARHDHTTLFVTERARLKKTVSADNLVEFYRSSIGQGLG